MRNIKIPTKIFNTKIRAVKESRGVTEMLRKHPQTITLSLTKPKNKDFSLPRRLNSPDDLHFPAQQTERESKHG